MDAASEVQIVDGRKGSTYPSAVFGEAAMADRSWSFWARFPLAAMENRIYSVSLDSLGS